VTPESKYRDGRNRKDKMEQIQKSDQAGRPLKPKLKARILVVDDDLPVADVVCKVLMNEGFDVEIASNGKSALDFLREDRQFDLVITDMRMPEMDGLELLREIGYSKDHLPVIVLTGYPTVENGIQSITEGAYDYLAKPFRARGLLEAVQAALASRLGRICEGENENLVFNQ
jgi:DNA-binding NtrC family response regulator